MKTFFSWVIGIGGLFLAGSIMNGPEDHSVSNMGFYEEVGRWVIGVIVAVATIVILYLMNRSSSENR